MAVLYRSQGFHDRAADVYRALLRARPDDQRLAAKLREAEEAAGPTTRPGTEDDAGEVWLRGVGAAWTGPGDTATEEATPYAWTAESDEGEAGDPIGAYLHDLVSWKAGSGAWMKPDVEESEAEEPAEVEVPDWLGGPGGSEAWAPDQPTAYPPVSAPEADWSPAQPAEPDPWDRTPGPIESAEVPAAPPAGPPAADGWQVPAESPAPPGVDAEVEDAGGGWTPLELDRDVPAAGAPPAAAPPGLQETVSEEDSSDDDDLEMFRSWLQSLKK
jgi:hypothetical protein